MFYSCIGISSSNNNDLVLEIDLNKDLYFQHEPIIIKSQIKNISENRVEFRNPTSYGGISFFYKSSNQKEFKKVSCSHPGPVTDSLLPLKSTEQYTTDLHIVNTYNGLFLFYPLNHGEKYQLFAKTMLPDRSNIISDTIEFEIHLETKIGKENFKLFQSILTSEIYDKSLIDTLNKYPENYLVKYAIFYKANKIGRSDGGKNLALDIYSSLLQTNPNLHFKEEVLALMSKILFLDLNRKQDALDILKQGYDLKTIHLKKYIKNGTLK